MKQLLLFASITFATTTIGQINNGKPSDILFNTTKGQVSDTALQVIYVDKNKLKQQPAYFVNEQFINDPSLLTKITPQNIKNLEVVKRDTLIGKILYPGQVFIEMMEDYTPRLITLTGLKNKYTNLKEKQVIFMLDGNFITADYETFMVDETNLLTIVIDNLQTADDKMDIGLIKILSKTKENIKERKKIIIRGADLSLNR